MGVILFLFLPLSGVISTTTQSPDIQDLSTSESTTPITSWTLSMQETTTPLPLWTLPSYEPTSESSTVPLPTSTLSSTSTLPSISSEPPPLGCPKCEAARCPRSTEECLLNVGLVPDLCLCCAEGVCGLPESAKCFSDAVANELPPGARALGSCGMGMECVLRTDLLPTDNPEALCSCSDHGPVCGTDNRTYSSSCRLAQESNSIWITHRGPCRAAPWIVSPPESELSVPLGGSVSFSCESKGYPTPQLHWERVGDVTANSSTTAVSQLPDDDSSMSVQLRGGPEPYMGSAWLQILEATKQHAGTYACVGVNGEGQAQALARLKVIASSESENPGR